MCGIIGGVSERSIIPLLLEGLKRLEYRGYDSAGIAFLDGHSHLQRVRCLGKVQGLVEKIHAPKERPLTGTVGIGHTRWATHGAPSERNAHPHLSGQEFALVHNGIIENHQEIRAWLEEKGYRFESETDTEVIVHGVHAFYQEQPSIIEAFRKLLNRLQGAYAIALISPHEPDTCFVARQGSPLLIGIGIGEHFVASDILALSPLTDTVLHLENGEMAALNKEQYRLWNAAGQEIQRSPRTIHHVFQRAERGEFRHFMHKEIFEQPLVLGEALHERLSQPDAILQDFGLSNPKTWDTIQEVHLVACGTSYYAGLIAAAWIEGQAQRSARVFLASEYRMSPPVVRAHTLWVGISQSGETADTLAALECAQKLGYASYWAICNGPDSALVRACTGSYLTQAGPEIGVASTKGFTTQLLGLFLLSLILEKKSHDIPPALAQIPALMQRTLALEPQIQAIAQKIASQSHAFFLGRGLLYPLALEAALKLKEIAYIHAQGYAAGELKHGPLALMDKGTPVIVHISADPLLAAKMYANMEEVEARGGLCFVFYDESLALPAHPGRIMLAHPRVDPLLAPFIQAILVQLLAYHVGIIKGTDIDQPRNLAKAVTVE